MKRPLIMMLTALFLALSGSVRSSTPSSAASGDIVQSRSTFLTTPTSFTPTLNTTSQSGNSIVLLTANSGGNNTWTIPSGWSRVMDLTDGNPVGLNMFYYPNAPPGTTFGSFTQSAAANLSYDIWEVSGTLNFAGASGLSSGATPVSSLTLTLNNASNYFLYAGFGVSQGSVPQTWAAPTGYTLINRDDTNTTSETIASWQFSTTSAAQVTEQLTTSAWAKGILAAFTVSSGGPSPGTIAGTVTGTSTGSPINAATVSFTGGSTTTSASGQYTLGNVTPGTYTVTASASGYASQSAQVTVTSGTTTTQNFALTSNGLTPLYAPTSFWNTTIPANPTYDANSASIVAASLAAYAGSAHFANDSDWGRAIAWSHNTDPVYTIGCTMYDCGNTVTFHIPNAATPETGSDHHLVVINLDTMQELDMWLASYSGGSWSAGSRYVTDASQSGWGALCAQGQHCGAAVAAGFAAFGGVVRPEEIQQGHIDHALALTSPLTRSNFIACPATHTDGQSSDPNSIPEGAHIQLDPAFNVDGQSWPQWEKIIAHALQTYGGYMIDTGGSIAWFGQGNQNGGLLWATVGVPTAPSLSNLPWSSFRVVQLIAC
jgi:hypothetical protein